MLMKKHSKALFYLSLLLIVFVNVISVSANNSNYGVFLFSIGENDDKEKISEIISDSSKKNDLVNDINTDAVYVISQKLHEQYLGTRADFYYLEGKLIIDVAPNLYVFVYDDDNPDVMTVKDNGQEVMPLSSVWFKYKMENASPEEKYNEYLKIYEKEGANSIIETGSRFGLIESLVSDMINYCGEGSEMLEDEITILIERMVESRAAFEVFENIAKECVEIVQNK